jgi:hypothetical protein
LRPAILGATHTVTVSSWKIFVRACKVAEAISNIPTLRRSVIHGSVTNNNTFVGSGADFGVKETHCTH